MKKSFALFLLLLCCILVCPAVAENAERETFEAGALKYALLEDGTAEIVWCERGAREAVVPDVLDGHRVTSVGEGAFANCNALISVAIPYGVTSIGDRAFASCWKLEGIDIPESVTSIGNEAFDSCEAFTSVTIPEGVTSIGDWVFSGCFRLTGIELPDSLITVGKNPFLRCDEQLRITVSPDHPALEFAEGGLYSKADRRLISYFQTSGRSEYIIPQGTVTIGDRAFYLCEDLVSITIPDSVTSVGDEAFIGCSGLVSITLPDGLTSVGDGCFSGCERLRDVTIPDSVTSIGDRAFDGCFSLASLTLPDGLTGIGKEAFAGCESLTSLTLPDGLAGIGEKAFAGCRSLTSIAIPDGVTGIGDGMFPYCESLISVTLPDSMTSIGAEVFKGCRSLASVTLPDGLTSIGDRAFAGCSLLYSVQIPDSVTTVGEEAFGDCSVLTLTVGPGSFAERYCADNGLTCAYAGDPARTGASEWDPAEAADFEYDVLPDGTAEILSYRGRVKRLEIPSALDGYRVTAIGESAFFYHEELLSVRIPDGVTVIGSEAFSDCSRLISVRIPDSVRTVGNGAFSGCESLISAALPYGVTSIGEYAFSYCENLISAVIPDSVTSIGEYAFSNCGGLVSAVIPNGVTSLRAGTFSMCTELTLAVIPDGVEQIGGHAFENCSALASVTIPDSVSSIGNAAFTLCTSLSSVTIPYGVTEIGERTFSDCESLVSVAIPESVTSIGSEAFYDCSSLASLVLPDSVASIGEEAFSYCQSLVSVKMPESMTEIGYEAFSDCDSLTSIVIPEGVTGIYGRTFESCDSLAAVTIPDSVTSIGDGAFNYCRELASVTIPDGVTGIGSEAFESCSALVSLVLPDSVASIGEYAFRKCGGLASLTVPENVTYIGEGAFDDCPELTLSVVQDSYAMLYCVDHGFPYALIDRTPSPGGGSAGSEPDYEVGSVLTLGRYEQDNDRSTGAEPIEWIVLARDGSRALLLSRYGLDSKPFNTEKAAVTWEDCSMRAWLNADFLDAAFTPEEQALIEVTYVDNSRGYSSGIWRTSTTGGSDTEDKVFLLSYGEANRYLGVIEDAPNERSENMKSRTAPTEYAKAAGAYTFGDRTQEGAKAGWWWLRSPGYYYQSEAAVVWTGGTIGYRDVNSGQGCVRPAVWIDLGAYAEAAASGADASEDPYAVRSVVRFGRYEQDDDLSNGKEEIEWIVLARDGSRALLLSRYGLDARSYTTVYPTAWETSDIRMWLNEVFMQAAFCAEEQQSILLTDVDNSADQGDVHDRDGGNDTQDRLFLLSYREAEQYLAVKSGGTNNVRSRVSPTAYAAASGAGTSDEYRTVDDEPAGWWWLRSMGDGFSDVACVGSSGYRGDKGTEYGDGCIRPAVWVDLEGPVFSDPELSARIRERNEVTVYDVMPFGRYEQDNDKADGTEAIEWIVLAREGDRALLVSRYALDAKPYNETIANVTWEDCTLRTWLNGAFLRAAFSPEEQRRILETNVDNSRAQGFDGEYGWSSDGGNDTLDRIFLLSYAEANRYFGVRHCVDYRAEQNKRARVVPTAYARASGEGASNAGMAAEGDPAVWWLRSPGLALGTSVSAVGTNGSLTIADVNSKTKAVRPALWIDLGPGVPEQEKRDTDGADPGGEIPSSEADQRTAAITELSIDESLGEEDGVSLVPQVVLTIRWQSDPEAGAYSVTLSDASGHTLYENDRMPNTSATIDASKLRANETYRFGVRPVVSGGDAEEGEILFKAVVRDDPDAGGNVGTPTIAMEPSRQENGLCTIRPGNVTLRWHADGPVRYYTVSITGKDGTTLMPPRDLTVEEIPLTISGGSVPYSFLVTVAAVPEDEGAESVSAALEIRMVPDAGGDIGDPPDGSAPDAMEDYKEAVRRAIRTVRGCQTFFTAGTEMDDGTVARVDAASMTDASVKLLAAVAAGEYTAQADPAAVQGMYLADLFMRSMSGDASEDAVDVGLFGDMLSFLQVPADAAERVIGWMEENSPVYGLTETRTVNGEAKTAIRWDADRYKKALRELEEDAAAQKAAPDVLRGIDLALRHADRLSGMIDGMTACSGVPEERIDAVVRELNAAGSQPLENAAFFLGEMKTAEGRLAFVSLNILGFDYARGTVGSAGFEALRSFAGSNGVGIFDRITGAGTAAAGSLLAGPGIGAASAGAEDDAVSDIDGITAAWQKTAWCSDAAESMYARVNDAAEAFYAHPESGEAREALRDAAYVYTGLVADAYSEYGGVYGELDEAFAAQIRAWAAEDGRNAQELSGCATMAELMRTYLDDVLSEGSYDTYTYPD